MERFTSRVNIMTTCDKTIYMCLKSNSKHLIFKINPTSRVNHSAGTVLPFSSAVCNVTTRIGDRMHMCWRLRDVNKMPYVSVSGPGPL